MPIRTLAGSISSRIVERFGNKLTDEAIEYAYRKLMQAQGNANRGQIRRLSRNTLLDQATMAAINGRLDEIGRQACDVIDPHLTAVGPGLRLCPVELARAGLAAAATRSFTPLNGVHVDVLPALAAQVAYRATRQVLNANSTRIIRWGQLFFLGPIEAGGALSEFRLLAISSLEPRDRAIAQGAYNDIVQRIGNLDREAADRMAIQLRNSIQTASDLW